jgi:cytochrome c-type biogenesis protein CcmH/NrfG
MAVDPSYSKLYLALALTYLSEHKAESGIMALRQLAHAKRLDYNDINLNAPIAEAHMQTGNPSDFESAYKAASQLFTIDPTDFSRLLMARTALETGRLAKGFDMLQQIGTRNSGKLDASGCLIMSGLVRISAEGQKTRSKN